MSNQGSSNHGPDNQGDHGGPPSRTPSPVNNASGAGDGDNLTPREEQLMLKMTDILRTTFEAYRKEERERGKGKDKVSGEPSSKTERFVTFKSFKANGATEFEGLTDPVTALLWLENTEKVFRIARVATEDETVYAGALLTKQALTWWNNTGKAMGIKERDEMPYEEFKARFLEQYCPKDMQRRLEKEFIELKQNDMTVSEYERVFNKKAQFASRYLPTEAEKIDIFVEGLRYEIKDFVTVREITSFAKAVEYARRREHDLEIRGALVSESKRKRMELSNSVSPVSSPQDISRDQSQIFSISPDVPRNCQKCGKDHRGYCDVSRRSISCYGCGKEGHIRSMCPDRKTKCFSCGSEGHRKKNCPMTQRQVTESRASVQQLTKAGSSVQKEEVPQAKSRIYQITPEDTQ